MYCGSRWFQLKNVSPKLYFGSISNRSNRISLSYEYKPWPYRPIGTKRISISTAVISYLVPGTRYR